MGMKKNRHTRRVATGLLFLCVMPGLTRAQSSTPSPMPAPPKAARVSRPKRVPSKADDFAGLNLTDDQKAKIEQVHQSMKRRRDAMVKDEKLTADQRDAMLEGYERMERGQVFELLTAEQRKEVREKIRARQAAEKVAQKKQSLPK
jgi:Spy/CpxP family protein refolding chaperone